MVDSNGKLYASQGEFTGKITADSGTIGGWKIYTNSLSNTDGTISISPDGIKWGNYLNINSKEDTFSGNLNAASGTFKGKLEAATGTFKGELSAATGTFSGELKAATGTFSGELSAATGTFEGTLSAATGSFTGAVTATSLTLGSGVSIGASNVSGLSKVATSGSYGDLSGTPDIPSDLTMYIKQDGTIGTLSSEVQNIPTGTKGFKVSSDGLLQASNAIIYGTIYASAGIIGGFNVTNIQNDLDHAYANTLYCQTRGQESTDYGTTLTTYDYQSGIKGNSSTSSAKEAAFYVRKKLPSQNWDDSTVPFYVRKNGQTFCESLMVADSICSQDSCFYFFVNGFRGNKNCQQVMNLDYNETYGSALYPSHIIMDLGGEDDHFRTLYVDQISMGGKIYTSCGGGEKGEKGDTGPRGPQGPQGPRGPAGVVDYGSISKLYNQNANDSSVLTLEGKNPWFGSQSISGHVHLGHASYRWANVYYSGKLDGSSDEHLKENITNLSLLNNVENIYMSLHPISYRFKTIDNDQTQNIHFGFGARETEQIFIQNNIDISQYSCITKNILESPNIVGDTEEYSMCYLDFIPLNTLMTQKAHHRIDSLESQLTDALSVIESLKKEIETLKQAME